MLRFLTIIHFIEISALLFKRQNTLFASLVLSVEKLKIYHVPEWLGRSYLTLDAFFLQHYWQQHKLHLSGQTSQQTQQYVLIWSISVCHPLQLSQKQQVTIIKMWDWLKIGVQCTLNKWNYSQISVRHSLNGAFFIGPLNAKLIEIPLDNWDIC